MPSNQTQNYSLNQWSKDDQVLMEDFNADNAKIDAAIKAEADARAAGDAALQAAVDTKAAAAALDALTQTVAGKARVAAGSYAGDGAASRVISVGFTPKAVYLCTNYGVTSGDFGGSQTYGGLAVTGSPLPFSYGGQLYTAMEIVSGGFRVFYNNLGDNYTIATNRVNVSYHYIAIG